MRLTHLKALKSQDKQKLKVKQVTFFTAQINKLHLGLFIKEQN